MKFNEIFSSGMVFAKNLPIRIYGDGNGCATISFAGINKEVTSVEGKWYVEFPPMNYGGPYELTLESVDDKIEFDDIYVGDVYLFAGQSNMQFKVCEGKDDPNLCETNDMLRIFTTKRIEDDEYFTPKDGWVKAYKDTAKYSSALAHFAGIKIAKEKNVAVGIVVAYQGASVIESWAPKDIFIENGILLSKEEQGQSHHTGPYSLWNHNGQLYDYMLSQVIPFSINGVVWYQGESDTTLAEAKVYGKELEIFIDVLRKDFNNENLPFIVIQLADFVKANIEAWSLLQKAQFDIQFKVPNVTTVISADVCPNDDIHPPIKFKLAQRLADTILKIW